MSLQRLTRPAALSLALATFAVPSTAAGQDLRSADARDGASVERAAHDLRSPDARSIAAPPVAATGDDLRSPDSRDAGEGRGTFNAPDVMVVEVDKPTPAPVAATDGIDWADAGIGAAGLLGFAALALAAAAIVMHHRRTATPA